MAFWDKDLFMEIIKLNLGFGFSVWKKIIFLGIFFLITPVTLVVSSLSLISLHNSEKAQAQNQQDFLQNPMSGVQVYASLPSASPSVSGKVIGSDARPEIIKEYLASFDSPLLPYADLIVRTADKYKIDYRLTTAIAQQESNLCKKIPDESYNCWGWGINDSGTLKFSSFADGIDEVSRGLKESYIDQGFLNPDQIMTKYTPLSNGSWAYAVNQFMQDLR